MHRVAGLSVALAALASHQGHAQGVTVRGVVYDSLHSRPLAGASVAIGSRATTTDSAGRFALDGVAPGSYRVAAQHDAVDRLGLRDRRASGHHRWIGARSRQHSVVRRLVATRVW